MSLQTASPYLPEQPESQASEAVRAIYAQIRHASAVPMVALIFRHLATLPGAMEWAWSVMGPPLAQGRLQERAWAMAQALSIEPVVTVPAAALGHLGIDAASHAELDRLGQAYGRANPVNLLALRLIALHLQGGLGHHRVAPVPACAKPAWQPPESLGPLLPMVDLHSAPPDLLALMQGLSQRGQSAPDSAFVPSYYRQLASRPPLLALASLIVAPAFERIDAAAELLRRQATEHAAALAADQSAPPPCPPALRQPMLAAVEVFTERIPEMIAVIRLMQKAVPAQGS
jgi:hypothetical protein